MASQVRARQLAADRAGRRRGRGRADRRRRVARRAAGVPARGEPLPRRRAARERPASATPPRCWRAAAERRRTVGVGLAAHGGRARRRARGAPRGRARRVPRRGPAPRRAPRHQPDRDPLALAGGAGGAPARTRSAGARAHRRRSCALARALRRVLRDRRSRGPPPRCSSAARSRSRGCATAAALLAGAGAHVAHARAARAPRRGDPPRRAGRSRRAACCARRSRSPMASAPTARRAGGAGRAAAGRAGALRPPPRGDGLTPSERRVAERAADGESQPRDRRGALPHGQVRRVAPGQHVPQARHPGPGRARRRPCASREREHRGRIPVVTPVTRRARGGRLCIPPPKEHPHATCRAEGADRSGPRDERAVPAQAGRATAPGSARTCASAAAATSTALDDVEAFWPLA